MTRTFCEMPREFNLKEIQEPKFKRAGIDVDDVLARTAETFMTDLAVKKDLLTGNNGHDTVILNQLMRAYWSKDSLILEQLGITQQEYEDHVRVCFIDPLTSPEYHENIPVYSNSRVMVQDVAKRAGEILYLTSRFDYNPPPISNSGAVYSSGNGLVEERYPNLYVTQRWISAYHFYGARIVSRKEGEGGTYKEWKVDRALSLGVDILIDDKLSTVAEFVSVAKQLGRKVSAILVAQPYNQTDKLPANVLRVPTKRVATAMDFVPKL